MWLTDARVVDVLTGVTHDGASVEISGDRIGAIQKRPGAGERMSLEGRYLVPGLLSVHTHLSAVYPSRPPTGTRTSDACSGRDVGRFVGKHEESGLDAFTSLARWPPMRARS